MKRTGFYKLICCYMLVCSCATIRNLREVSSTRHLQKVSSLRFITPNGKERSIRTDGYYLQSRHNSFGIGTEVLVLYGNGIAATYYINLEKQSVGMTDFSQVVLKPNKNSDGALYVGPYKISHDTLYVNLYRKDILSGLEIYRHYFHIVNSDSLFCFRIDAPQQVSDGKMAVQDEDMGYNFVLAKNLQKPRDHFLRKRDWMWENSSDWVEYMNTYRQKN